MSSYNKFFGFNNNHPNKSKMIKLLDAIYKSIDLELKATPDHKGEILGNKKYMEDQLLNTLDEWAGTWDEGRAIRAQGKATYLGGRRRSRRRSTNRRRKTSRRKSRH